MSDIDSDPDNRSPKPNKLGLDEFETNNNIFAYQRRSGRDSSNASDDDHVIGGHRDDEEDEDEGRGKDVAEGMGAMKLSQMLGEDGGCMGASGLGGMEGGSGGEHVTQQYIKQSPQIENKQVHEAQPVHQSSEHENTKESGPDLKENSQEIQKQLPTVQQPKIIQNVSAFQLKQNSHQAQQPKQVKTATKIDEEPSQTKKQQVKQKQPQPTKLQKFETIIREEIKETFSTPSKIIDQITSQIKTNSFFAKQQTKPKPADPVNEAQLKYNKQLEDDLAILKKNVKKKKTPIFSEKQSQKHKLNKTMMPAATTSQKELQFQQTAQTKALELKMITTMAQEKKKQNYNRLREWDKRRAQSLAVHRNMIEILQTQIDKRIKSSIENLQIYTTFLREKAKQEEKYVSHPVINTKYALQNNSISKNVYINCTATLNSLSDENNLRCRKINDFIHLIRNDILRDSVQVHLMQSQRELLKVREKISNLKAALRKHNSETEEKTSELSLFFNENSVNMSIQTDRDFYSTQIQFLQKASQQTYTQKKLGQNCLEYLHTAIKQQIKRSKVIKQAMVTFSKALQQCYSIETDSAQIQQLSKAQEDKLIEQFYSLEQIFDQRCLAVFNAHTHAPTGQILTIQIFTDFIKKFEFEGFDSRMILLKEFNVRYHPSSKSQANTQQNCYIVITVDKWIHLYLSKQKTDPYIKPDVSIRASMKNFQMRPNKSLIVDLVIKEEKRNSMISYFWESKNDRIYRIEFQKKDSREEFMDYVTKIKG